MDGENNMADSLEQNKMVFSESDKSSAKQSEEEVIKSIDYNSLIETVIILMIFGRIVGTIITVILNATFDDVEFAVIYGLLSLFSIFLLIKILKKKTWAAITYFITCLLSIIIAASYTSDLSIIEGILGGSIILILALFAKNDGYSGWRILFDKQGIVSEVRQRHYNEGSNLSGKSAQRIAETGTIIKSSCSQVPEKASTIDVLSDSINEAKSTLDHDIQNLSSITNVSRIRASDNNVVKGNKKANKRPSITKIEHKDENRIRVWIIVLSYSLAFLLALGVSYLFLRGPLEDSLIDIKSQVNILGNTKRISYFNNDISHVHFEKSDIIPDGTFYED